MSAFPCTFWIICEGDGSLAYFGEIFLIVTFKLKACGCRWFYSVPVVCPLDEHCRKLVSHKFSLCSAMCWQTIARRDDPTGPKGATGKDILQICCREKTHEDRDTKMSACSPNKYHWLWVKFRFIFKVHNRVQLWPAYFTFLCSCNFVCYKSVWPFCGLRIFILMHTPVSSP